ncbi:hypothetical protein M0802_004711 [Mischocyttarus mexicanus]|nr:hypothetical protein M0802_004711 [Mischocyttarus mexicanus]
MLASLVAFGRSKKHNVVVFRGSNKGECRLYPKKTTVAKAKGRNRETSVVGCNDYQSLFSATFSKHFKLFRTPCYVRYPAMAPKLSQKTHTNTLLVRIYSSHEQRGSHPFTTPSRLSKRGEPKVPRSPTKFHERIPDGRVNRIHGISMVILIRALNNAHVLTQESHVGNSKVYPRMPEAGPG